MIRVWIELTRCRNVGPCRPRRVGSLAPSLGSGKDVVADQSGLSMSREVKLFVEKTFDAVDADLMTRDLFLQLSCNYCERSYESRFIPNRRSAVWDIVDTCVWTA